MSVVAAHTFRLDVKGAEVRQALRAAGIRTVLLKGRSLARLLYADDGSRTYDDVDLLMEPSAVGAAEGVLRDLGFRLLEDDSPSGQTDPVLGGMLGAVGALHGRTWIRDADEFPVDIHDSLPQVHTQATIV